MNTLTALLDQDGAGVKCYWRSSAVSEKLNSSSLGSQRFGRVDASALGLIRGSWVLKAHEFSFCRHTSDVIFLIPSLLWIVLFLTFRSP
jgi:hypothetical protein